MWRNSTWPNWHKNVNKEDKMVSCEKNSLASELLSKIITHKFTQVLCLLNPDHALTVDHFK